MTTTHLTPAELRPPPQKRTRTKKGRAATANDDGDPDEATVEVNADEIWAEVDGLPDDMRLPPQPDEQEIEDDLARLERETHEYRVDADANNPANQSTNKSYAGHVRAYVNFWVATMKNRVAPYPILPSKVALFLISAESREKKGGGRLGTTALQQILNAVEKERKATAYRFPSVPDTILRNDLRIRSLESNWKKDQARRTMTGNSLKAAGGTQERITEDQRTQIFDYWFTKSLPSQVAHTGTNFRDLAMFLISCVSAHRGANTRELAWSDLVYHEHKVPLASLSIPTLVLLANNGKTNREGRLDQVGIWRHKDPSSCGVFGVALHLFWSDQILGMERPPFEPDFATDDPEIGPYGFRQWYFRTLFNGRMGSEVKGKQLYHPMTYQTHNNAVKGVLDATGVRLSHTTHAGRTSAARNASMYNATEHDTKAHGLWRDGGSFRSCYMRELPISAIAALAGFDGRYIERYWVPRADIAPPPELLATIFPWIEEAYSSYQKRASSDPHCNDFALDGFLKVLAWFRSVLLQDLAVLRSRFPAAPIFSFAPFNTPAFDIFASHLVKNVDAAEQAKAQEFPELPSSISDALGTAVGQIFAKMNEHFAKITTLQIQLREEQADTMDAVLGLSMGTVRKRSREGADSIAMMSDRINELTGMVYELSERAFSLVAPAQALQRPDVPSRSDVHRRPEPLLGSSFSIPHAMPVTATTLAPRATTLAPRTHVNEYRTRESGLASAPSRGVEPSSVEPSSVAPFSTFTSPTSLPPLSRDTPRFEQSCGTTRVVTGLVPTPANLELPIPPASFGRALPAFPQRGRPSTILQPAAYSPAPDDREEKMRALWTKFGRKIEAMEFWWFGGTGAKPGSWVPFYLITSFGSVTQVWREWDQGKEGCLAIKDIEAEWNTAWRPRKGGKAWAVGFDVGSTGVHFARMSKLAGFVREVANERSWAESKVIKFLEDKVKKSARDLVDALSHRQSGDATKQEFLAAAVAWDRAFS